MLQDSEEFEEATIIVYADSGSQAQAIGERRVQAFSDSSTIVVCVDCRKASKTKNKYICTLRIEVR